MSAAPLFIDRDDTGQEAELSGDLYRLFAAIISREAGINLGPHKKPLLTARLSKRMKVIGCGSFHEYHRLVKRSREELIEMLNAIAINTTKFFREPYHFEFLRDKALPELLSRRAPEKVLRIWSAGCSTGEEPYSIAISLFEALQGAQVSHLTWDMKILASDISTRALQTAEEGVYELDQIPEEAGEEVRDRYFEKARGAPEGFVAVKPFVRDIIRFRRLNLKDRRFPFQRRFDIIFCRNVMIYFDEAMQRHVTESFRTHLSPGGYLFLGHSESMIRREGFRPAFITVYQKTP